MVRELHKMFPRTY